MASFQITITDMVHPDGTPGVQIAAGAADCDKTAPPTEAVRLGYGILKILKEWGEQKGAIVEKKAGSLDKIDAGPSLHERSKPRTPMRRAPKGHR